SAKARHFPHTLDTKVGVHDGRVWFFRYPQALVPDPQGQVVDIAARLCSMASKNQLICTEESFKDAGGADIFKNHSPATKRFIRGVPEPRQLVAIVPNESADVGLVPLAGHDRPEQPAAIRERERAYEHFLRGEYGAALRILKDVIGGDLGNFHANLQAA